MEKERLCCNCLHCARWKKSTGIECHCDLDDKYLGYLQVMDEDNNCENWEKETKWDLQEEHDAKVRETAIEEFISEIDLDKPMHFTKEQAAWIKKYVILKKHDAIDELVKEFDKSIKYEIRSEYWWTDVIVRMKKIAEQLKEG